MKHMTRVFQILSAIALSFLLIAPVSYAQRTAQISIERAKQIALSHAGLKASQAQFGEIELDQEWGFVKYEIEFYANGTKYEYDIDANTGKVIKFEQKIRGY